MYNYVVSAQKPTAVTHSVSGSFTDKDHLNLIVAKCTKIELFLVTPQGLVPQTELSIYGRIASMELFRPMSSSDERDWLFVLTERLKFIVLAYDPKTGEIVTKASGDLKDKVGRPTESGAKGIIQPDRKMIGFHLYEGTFKIVPIDERGRFSEAISMRLEEREILDIKFIHALGGSAPLSQPTIAVLYQDSKNARHVKTYEVNVKDRELVDGPFYQPNVESAASMLVPVPAPLGGLLIIGEQTITYHMGSSFKSIPMDRVFIRTVGKIDQDGSRWLLGDHHGTLYVLVLSHEGPRVTELTLEPLGKTTAPSSISYLDNGVIFVGSDRGDSHLIRLSTHRDESGSYLEPISSFNNIGPILDFCVVDLEKQGQGQVVTCSGVGKDGTLRVVRNGIGINEISTLELPAVKGLWSLRENEQSPFEKFIILSFIGETRVLQITGEELEEAEPAGFDRSQPTLLCANASDNNFVQVTPQGLRLIDAESLEAVDVWRPAPGHSINVASACGRQVVLATGGGNLVYIEINGKKLTEVKHVKLEHEISCLDLHPLGDSATSNLVAVGMWTEISVRVLALPTLEQVTKEELGGEILPRSVLFSTFEGVNYLLCALGDGHLFTFKVDTATGLLSDRKKVSLGTQPIVLTPFSTAGTAHVFASSDRPSVIYSSNKKLLFSNVNLKEVNYMCPFHSESFPDSLAIATENALVIGTIDEIQKLHIRSVPLGEQPRRICHQESTRCFGLVSERTSVDENGDEMVSAFFKIVDDQTFEIVHEFPLDPTERGSAIVSCKFSNDSSDYFVVGTTYILPEESEPSRGRILVFEAKERRINLVVEKETKGAVYCFDPFNGKLLAGVNSKIQLYRWTVDEEGGPKDLTLECGNSGHVLTLSIQSRGDFIIFGDLMRSVSLLMYKSVDGSLEQIARDHSVQWTTATEILDDETFIACDASFNLFTLRRRSDAERDEDRRRLEMVGCYHLGDVVNKFRHGSLQMKQSDTDSDSLANSPTLLFGTVNGVIGVLAQLPQPAFEFLGKVQTAMNTVVKGVGALDHKEFRTFVNEQATKETRNFLDGDLIEVFLELKSEKQLQVVRDLKRQFDIDMSVEELVKKIEELQYLH